MAWLPPELQNLKLMSPFTIGNVLASGPQLGQIQDAGFAGITGGNLNAGVQMYLPPVGDPHVANDVYIRASDGRWRVSTG